MTSFRSDLRTTLRGLFRTPGFLVAVVTTLALGLGANAILFNAVYALLWRPLDFQESERLVSVVHQLPTGERLMTTSLGEAALLRDRVDAFSEVGLTGGHDPIILRPDQGGPQLKARTVNRAYLEALKLNPLCGRFFTEEEERDNEPMALLTERTWRSQFGADPGILGRMMPTESMGRRGQLRVIGVVPGGATLPFASEAQILLPGPRVPPFDGSRDGNFGFVGVLRLKPGSWPVSLPSGPRSRSIRWRHCGASDQRSASLDQPEKPMRADAQSSAPQWGQSERRRTST